MRPAPAEDFAPPMDVSTILSNAAIGMAELARLVHHLEDAIFDDEDQQTGLRNQPALHQDIDLITQTIAEFRDLIIRLAAHTAKEPQLAPQDIIAPIRLEKLRNLIAHGESKSTASALKHGPQEIDLFD